MRPPGIQHEGNGGVSPLHYDSNKRPMNKNELITAVAGSGKTTMLVEEAIRVQGKQVLVTTFTRTNAEEIKSKFLARRGLVPRNIKVQTWFSLLLQHGVRPFQTVMHPDLEDKKIGFRLHEGKPGYRFTDSNGIKHYWGEADFFQFYFAYSKGHSIYSDKISRFIFECNRLTNGEVISRIARVFDHILIDEVQDLAGWDLELLKLLLQSKARILMVGDPRQGTYTTNDAQKHKKYRNEGIVDFFAEKCKNEKVTIDNEKLIHSHRNCLDICVFSSSLYPSLPNAIPCDCEECRREVQDHLGLYLVMKKDVPHYVAQYHPQVLRYSESNAPELNFGQSKGLGFPRVLIHPTKKIEAFLRSGDLGEIKTVAAKFYVAVTRAKYSVGIVTDYDDGIYVRPLQKYNC